MAIFNSYVSLPEGSQFESSNPRISMARYPQVHQIYSCCPQSPNFCHTWSEISGSWASAEIMGPPKTSTCIKITYILGGSFHLVSGLVHPSFLSGLTLQKSHVNHWGYNPLTIRGMSHQVTIYNTPFVKGETDDQPCDCRNTPFLKHG